MQHTDQTVLRIHNEFTIFGAQSHQVDVWVVADSGGISRKSMTDALYQTKRKET